MLYQRIYTRLIISSCILISTFASSTPPNSTIILNHFIPSAFSIEQPCSLSSDGFGSFSGIGAELYHSLEIITYGQVNQKQKKENYQQTSEQSLTSSISFSMQYHMISSSSEPSSAGGDGDPPEKYNKEKFHTDTDFQQLIEQINNLMEKLPEEVFLTLICDKDDTILESDEILRTEHTHIRQMFTKLVDTWRSQNKMRFIIVTHHSLRYLNLGYFSNNQLPTPDFLVSIPSASDTSRHASINARPGLTFDEGRLMPMSFHLKRQNITNFNNYFLFERYGEFLNKLYSGQYWKQLKQLFRCNNNDPTIILKFIKHSEKQRRLDFTFSFVVEQIRPQDNIANAIRSIFGQMVTMSFHYSNRNIVSVSFPTTKGEWLSVLANAFSIQENSSMIMVAGDGMPDLSMMNPPNNAEYSVLLPVLVNNADSQTKNKSGGAFISKSPYATGVLEGILETLEKALNNDNG